MVDFAELVLTARTDGLKKGEAALDSLARKGAEAEAKTTKSTKGMEKGFDGAAAGAKKAAPAVKGVGDAAGGMAPKTDRATEAAKRFGQQNRIAAGNLGNLTAQFNDIGVMLAAGQNPLQLAIQQGTQISQVIGPMGATGAVKALGSAFMGMLNPVSLATIGIIAGGAALFQWATRASESAEEADRLSDALQEIRDRSAEAELELKRMTLGLETTEEVLALQEIARLEKEIAQARASATPGLEGQRGSGFEVEQLERQLDAQRELLEQDRLRREQLADLKARTDEMAEAERMLGEQMAEAVRARAVAEANANAEAQAMLATMSEQNGIMAAIVAHGEDSARVSELRADAERRALEELLESSAASEDLKNELRLALQQGQALEALNIAGSIGAGANEAARLAENMGIAYSLASRIAGFGPQGVGGSTVDENGMQYGGRGGDPRQFGDTSLDRSVVQADRFLESWKPPRIGRGGRGGGGGGGTSDAQRERKKLMEDGVRLTESLWTATEKYNDSIEQADRLLAAGAITLDTYNKHVAQLGEELVEVQFGPMIDGITTVTDSLIDAAFAGDDMLESFVGALKQMAVEALKSNLKEILTDQLTPGRPGGGGGGGFGFLGNLLGGLFGGFRADGGPVSPGKAYIVGERGPEMIVPQSPGQVVPNNEMGGAMGGKVDVRVYVDQDGNWKAAVENTAGNVAAQLDRSVVKNSRNRFPSVQSDVALRGT